MRFGRPPIGGFEEHDPLDMHAPQHFESSLGRSGFNSALFSNSQLACPLDSADYAALSLPVRPPLHSSRKAEAECRAALRELHGEPPIENQQGHSPKPSTTRTRSGWSPRRSPRSPLSPRSPTLHIPASLRDHHRDSCTNCAAPSPSPLWRSHPRSPLPSPSLRDDIPTTPCPSKVIFSPAAVRNAITGDLEAAEGSPYLHPTAPSFPHSQPTGPRSSSRTVHHTRPWRGGGGQKSAVDEERFSRWKVMTASTSLLARSTGSTLRRSRSARRGRRARGTILETSDADTEGRRWENGIHPPRDDCEFNHLQSSRRSSSAHARCGPSRTGPSCTFHEHPETCPRALCHHTHHVTSIPGVDPSIRAGPPPFGRAHSRRAPCRACAPPGHHEDMGQKARQMNPHRPPPPRPPRLETRPRSRSAAYTHVLYKAGVMRPSEDEDATLALAEAIDRTVTAAEASGDGYSARRAIIESSIASLQQHSSSRTRKSARPRTLRDDDGGEPAWMGSGRRLTGRSRRPRPQSSRNLSSEKIPTHAERLNALSSSRRSALDAAIIHGTEIPLHPGVRGCEYLPVRAPTRLPMSGVQENTEFLDRLLEDW